MALATAIIHNIMIIKTLDSTYIQIIMMVHSEYNYEHNLCAYSIRHHSYFYRHALAFSVTTIMALFFIGFTISLQCLVE